MKTLIITTILAVLATVGTVVRGQDLPEEYLGLPGDNLNLYAVMDLFQESKTLEEFENKLNAKDSRINNLDLNGDNYVDYITVTDFVDGKIHTIVLRAVLGKDEYQDVGVFIVERLRKGQLRIQLIGDEALYGKNYIIEPKSETPNPGYGDDLYYGDNVTVINNIYYYDLSWPIFDWIFMPDYVGWHSGWYWGYWPAYWSPWNPWYWHQYYGYHYNWYPYYRDCYRHWNHPVHSHYTDFYYSNIRYHSTQVERRKTEGHYKETYSRPDTRRDGEALYESVSDSRRRDDRSGNGRGTVAAGDESRRGSEMVTREQSQVTAGEGRRSPDATGERTRVSTGSTGERTRVSTGSTGERTRVSTGQTVEESRGTSSEVKGTPDRRPAGTATSQESRRQELTTLEDGVSSEAAGRGTTNSTQVERSTYQAPERSSYSAPSRSSSESSSYSAPARSSSSGSGSSYSAPERSSSPAPSRSSSESSSSSAPVRSSSGTPEKSSTETSSVPAPRRR